MKKSIFQMVFKGICFFLVMLTTLSINAQPVRYAHIPQEEREQLTLDIINEAEYVVEGKSKGFRYFYGDDGKTIYTEFTFEVSHWYKGKGRSTISIVKKGGRIGDDDQSSHYDAYLSLGGVTKHIVLLKRSNKKGTYEFAKKISPVIAGSNDGSVWGGFYNLGFKSFEELIAFLSKAEEMKMPAKKKDVGFQKSLNPPVMIDDITPSVVRAGVGDVIVISGSGFGTMKGKVLFRNADLPELSLNGTSNYLTNLDDFYYDTSNPNGDNPMGWKDDEIRVIVPSWVPSAAGQEPGACTGRVKVQHADGSVPATSEQILTVEYAIDTYSRKITDLNKNPVRYGYIGMEHCLSGYVFTLHNSFEGDEQDKVDARASVEAALTAWRNALDITLQIEKDADSNYIYADFNEADHRMVIRFANQNALMSVTTGYLGDIWDITTYYRRFSTGISIKNEAPGLNGVDWEFKHTGNIAAGKSDFYAAFLHEVGHLIGVHHSVVPVLDEFGNPTDQIDYNNIMSYAQRSGPPLTEAQRLKLTNYNNNTTTVAGNLLVVGDSRNHIWSDNYTDFYGIETLAAVGNLSVVQPTPSVHAQLWWILTNNNFEHLYRLTPQPFNSDNDYYWLGGLTADGFWEWACGDFSPSTHYVRVKNDACTVSSLYSLPKTIGEVCLGFGRDDDASVPTNHPLISIYPNPTKGHFNIQFEAFEGVEIPNEIETYVGVYDNLGRLQHQHSVSDATLRQTTIDISTLPAGTYWVVWFVGGEVIDTQQV